MIAESCSYIWTFSLIVVFAKAPYFAVRISLIILVLVTNLLLKQPWYERNICPSHWSCYVQCCSQTSKPKHTQKTCKHKTHLKICRCAYTLRLNITYQLSHGFSFAVLLIIFLIWKDIHMSFYTFIVNKHTASENWSTLISIMLSSWFASSHLRVNAMRRRHSNDSG